MINKTPVASRVLHVHDDCHGERRDYYHWLRDSSWPQVRDQKILDYLTAENDYADSQISHGVTELLFQEMKDRIQEEDFTVPYLDGGYYYYSEIKKGQQYWTHKRKKSLDAQSAEILVDENILAIDHEYLKVGAIKVSPNQKLVAYTLDVAGSERYTLYIKDISADITIDAGVSDLMANIEWDAGSTGIFYTPAGKFWRSESIYFHRVGSDVAQDKLLYHENEATFSVYFRKSNSKKYIFFASKSSNSSEVYFINSAEPTAVPKLIAARTEGHIYSPEHHGDFFYIRTNDISPNFRIVRVAIDNPSQHQWQSYIGDSEEYIKELITYRDHLVVVSKRHGLAVIKVIALSDFSIKELEFADSTYEVSVEFTTFDAVSLRYKYSSLNTPLTVFEHHFDTSDLSTLKIQEFSSRFALKDYVLERIWAESDDGVKVPVSIFYHSQQVKLDGSAPLYLYGYGSYGLAVPDHFRTTIFSLVDRGFVYAIAHIRGGDELGKQWHEDAKFLTKKSTFIDFICVAETLIAQKYTSAKQIVIHGGSAGGMLVGCCINMRSDLYHAAIAEVPFVDVLSTMLDDTLPLTPYEFKEWGNPKEALYYEYMQSYSPYDNVEAKDYPHLLVTAGLADPRVGYWEPAKWVALLRYLKTDNNLLLLKTEMGAGHGGPSGRFDYLKEIAVNYAFILKVFGRDEYAPE